MRFPLCCLLLLLLAACSETRKDRPPQVPPPPLWADYKVWAAEGDSMATCLIQFYDNPQKRQSLWLEAPYGVAIDGQPLAGDSAGITGAYYELRAPLESLAGTHRIAFSGPGGHRFVDSFTLRAFRLAVALPESVAASGQELAVEGLPEGSQVRVVMTDTSFAGSGYNELKTVRNGKLLLSPSDLAGLQPGPVVLHLSAEEERPLRSRLQGVLSVTYELNRMFELRR